MGDTGEGGLMLFQSKCRKKEPLVVSLAKGTTLAIGNQWLYVRTINNAIAEGRHGLERC